MWIRQHWRLLVGLLLIAPPLWRGIRWLLQFLGDFDFLIDRIDDPGWMASVISWSLDPPPWLTLPLILGGLALIYWDLRRPRKTHTQDFIKTTPRTETVAFGAVFTVTARRLFSLFGATLHALNFSMSTGESGVFDTIKGHGLELYTYDCDGDGAEELIVRYHCGAHNHGMRVYKILAPPSGPLLIPGADIKSDFSEITWRPRKDGNGVVIHASSRNHAGSPASDPPIVERYIFENGRCVRAPDDMVLES